MNQDVIDQNKTRSYAGIIVVIVTLLLIASGAAAYFLMMKPNPVGTWSGDITATVNANVPPSRLGFTTKSSKVTMVLDKDGSCRATKAVVFAEPNGRTHTIDLVVTGTYTFEGKVITITFKNSLATIDGRQRSPKQDNLTLTSELKDRNTMSVTEPLHGSKKMTYTLTRQE